jgi:hypothetical protein
MLSLPPMSSSFPLPLLPSFSFSHFPIYFLLCYAPRSHFNPPLHLIFFIAFFLASF